MENQASLHLCNLIDRGYTMEEAKAIIAGANTSPSVATVGTEGAIAPSGATEGEPPTPPIDPPATPTVEGAKPAWMP